jgi:hypothetical protein
VTHDCPICGRNSANAVRLADGYDALYKAGLDGVPETSTSPLIDSAIGADAGLGARVVLLTGYERGRRERVRSALRERLRIGGSPDPERMLERAVLAGELSPGSVVSLVSEFVRLDRAEALYDVQTFQTEYGRKPSARSIVITAQLEVAA